MSKKIRALSQETFPDNQFFNHLAAGTKFYQAGNFERASEEWGAANRLHYSEPVPLKKVGGQVSCGINLDQIPFLFFLYAVFSNKLDGIGVVKTNGQSRKILFNGGQIVRAGTTRLEERLGRFILAKSNFSEEDLEDMVHEAGRKGVRIGHYLVDHGLLSHRELQEVLALQVQEILGDVLRMDQGVFYFVEGRVKQEISVSYTPLHFALVSAKRAYDFSDFRRRIPSNKIIFKVSPYLEGSRKDVLETLNVNEQFIFSLIDGTRNIQQLIQFSGADEVSVTNILYRLSSLGLIRRSKEVVEYEDSEYMELSKVMTVLFEVYGLITSELFNELGKMGQETITQGVSHLKPDYQKVFEDVPLDQPENLSEQPIFRNLATYYPSPEQRIIFIEAFHAVYTHLLSELKRYLGLGMSNSTKEKIWKKMNDIERFATNTELKRRLMEVLSTVIEDR